MLTRVKAALESLIEERGPDGLSIPIVAERAGIQPSSLYRRWGDLGTLMNEIATYKLDPARPIAVTGDLLHDLRAWANEIVTHYSRTENAAMLRAGAATAGDRESDCLRNRRTEAALLVEASTTVPDVDVDAVLNHIVAPIIYRVVFLPWTLDEALVDDLVEDLRATMPPTPASPRA